MSETDLRAVYLSWTRRAAFVVMLPLALTAALQIASSSAWWSLGPPPAGGIRYMFVSIGGVAIIMGRNAKRRETATPPLEVAAILSLSWRLVIYALAPVVIGAVLAFMTRQMGDFYLMLVVTLVGIVMLYPRYDQWLAWSARHEEPE